MAAKAVNAEMKWDRENLRLVFTVAGDISAIVVPPPANAVHTDELWRTTCFEMFLMARSPAYLEYNFSPSGAWAEYGFEDYRAEMRPVSPLVFAPETTVRVNEDSLVVEIATMEQPIAGAPFNLAAVIEERDGRKSYWSLAHPDGPPDFHDPTCFIARLPE